MERKEVLCCIGCPLGCMLTVTIEENQVKHVKGHTCNRGSEYAKKECTNPTRFVTSSVMVSQGTHPMVSVKTQFDIPKDKISQCIKELKGIKVTAPISIGDIIVENVADTHVNIIATRNIASI